MGMAFRQLVKRMAATAAVIAFALAFVATLPAGAVTQDVTTAKSNDTSTGAVLGGTPTRVTWEAVVDEGESVSGIKLAFPDGSDLTDETTVRLAVLEGTQRLDVDGDVTVDTVEGTVSVAFNTPVEAGQRIRVITNKASLPNLDGEVSLSASAKFVDGSVEGLGDSPSIEVATPSATTELVGWLKQQPWVQWWNSVTFLHLFFDPTLIVQSVPTLFAGWLRSLALVAGGFPLAIPLGLLAAFMKIGKSRVLSALAAVYTGLIRGTPLFLQIYIAFFGLPLLGIHLNEYLLAVFVMAFNSGAYLCEIFRAGIQSIPRGQFEASRSLGMTAVQTMTSVILPQTVRRVIPTMTSEFILLYKDTSLLAAIGVPELMLFARGVVSNTGNMTPYIVAAIFYLVVTLPLIRVVTTFENRLALADGARGSDRASKKGKKGLFGFARTDLAEGGVEAPLAENPARPVTIDEDAVAEAQAAKRVAREDEARAEALRMAAAELADDVNFLRSAHGADNTKGETHE